MECPRCNHSQPAGRAACSACGVIFAKWQAHQPRGADAQPMPMRGAETVTFSPAEQELEDCTNWIDHAGRWAAALLLLGFAWPLRKASLLAGGSLWIWPWHLLGPPAHPLMAAALATPSAATALGQWALVVLGAGLAVVGLRFVPVLSTRVALMTGVGSGVLVVLLVVYYQEAEILGLAFAPPTRGAGVVLFVFLVSGALVVASNRLRKAYPTSPAVRIAAGIGGIGEGLLVFLVVVGGEGPWAAWSMIPLYLLLGVQASLALYSAAVREVSAAVTTAISRLARLSLGWGTLAIVIAQETASDPYFQYAVKAGGGTLTTLMSAIKGFLMYFGSAYLMTVGVAGLMSIGLARRAGHALPVSDYAEPKPRGA